MCFGSDKKKMTERRNEKDIRKKRQLLTKTKQQNMKGKAKRVEEFCKALLKGEFVSVSSSHWQSSVLPSSLCCGMISFCVVNMMWQLERVLSMTIYLKYFRIFFWLTWNTN